MKRRMRIAAMLLWPSVVCLYLGGGAYGQTTPGPGCRDANPDVRIAECSAFIRSRSGTAAIRADAFLNRGLAYDQKGQHGRLLESTALTILDS